MILCGQNIGKAEYNKYTRKCEIKYSCDNCKKPSMWRNRNCCGASEPNWDKAKFTTNVNSVLGFTTSLTAFLSFPPPENTAIELGPMGAMGAMAVAIAAKQMEEQEPNCETKVTRSGRSNKIAPGLLRMIKDNNKRTGVSE